MRTLLSIAVLALLPLPVAAQIGAGGTNYTPDDTGRMGNDHIAPMPGSMTQTVHGEMTGDFLEDAVVLVGDQPVFLFNAGLHHALTDLPAQGHVMACLKRGAPDGRDALVLGSSRQLELWYPDVRKQTFLSETIGSPAWVDLDQLRTGDLLGDGGQGIVGLNASRNGLLVMKHPRSGTDVLIPAGFSIYSIELVQWDGLPGLEIAMMTSEGFKICDLDLLPIYEDAAGGENDMLAVLPQPVLGYDRVVACVQVGANVYLNTADQYLTDPAINLGPAALTGMVCADFNDDKQDDLLISQQTTGQLVLFTNTMFSKGHSFSWNPGSWTLYDLTEDKTGSDPAPWNHATPVFADLDNDGDADILHPVGKEQTIVLMRSETHVHQDEAPRVASGCYQLDEDSGESRITLKIDPPSVAPGKDDAIEVVLWRQNDATSPTDPIPFLIQEHPLTGWPATVVLEFTEPQPSNAIFHAQMRLIDYNPIGATAAAAPCIVHSLTRSLSSKDELVELHGVDPGDVVVLGQSNMDWPCGTTPYNDYVPGQVGTTPRTGANGAQAGGGVQGPFGPRPGSATGTPGGLEELTGDEGSSSVPLTCVPCFTDGWIPWGI